jgi:hypothetical protein
MCQSCQTWPAKFGQILLRTDTRLVFCNRKLMRTDIFFSLGPPNPYAISRTLVYRGDTQKCCMICSTHTCICDLTLSIIMLTLYFIFILFVTRLTWQVPQVEQELLILPEHLSSPPVFSGVRVTWSLVLCLRFVDRCLSFCPFTFGHCVVCPSTIYGFFLPL